MNDPLEPRPVITTEDLVSLGVPAALAALTLGTVCAFDAQTMTLSILLWCVVWVVSLATKRTLGWTTLTQRVVLATGFAWTLLFVVMVLTFRTYTVNGQYAFVSTGWPCPTSAAARLGESSWQANLSWLWSQGAAGNPPRIYHSNRCATNLWLCGAVGALAVAWLPRRWLASLLTVVRFSGPIAALLAYAVVPFPHVS